MTDADLLFKLLILGSMVANLIASLARLRRQPPLSEDLYRGFCTKAELAERFRAAESALADRIAHSDKVHAEIFSVLRANQNAVATSISDLERSIGRVEGAVNQLGKIQ